MINIFNKCFIFRDILHHIICNIPSYDLSFLNTPKRGSDCRPYAADAKWRGWRRSNNEWIREERRANETKTERQRPWRQTHRERRVDDRITQYQNGKKKQSRLRVGFELSFFLEFGDFPFSAISENLVFFFVLNGFLFYDFLTTVSWDSRNIKISRISPYSYPCYPGFFLISYFFPRIKKKFPGYFVIFVFLEIFLG